MTERTNLVVLDGGAPRFDIVDHHRQRTRRAEARVDALERHRDQLQRILILALQMAVSNSGVNPLELLAVLEDADREIEKPKLSDNLVRLLRETAP